MASEHLVSKKSSSHRRQLPREVQEFVFLSSLRSFWNQSNLKFLFKNGKRRFKLFDLLADKLTHFENLVRHERSLLALRFSDFFLEVTIGHNDLFQGLPSSFIKARYFVWFAAISGL